MSPTDTIDPEILRRYIDSAVPHLERYFLTEPYTGAHFERLAGGGDRTEVANEVTPADLVAVTMLSVRVPPSAALEVLGPKASELTALLEQIPTDIDLWDAAEDLVSGGSAADEIWQLLNDTTGIGWVTAGKLLSRKRPRLVPVYDSVVKAALGLDGPFWLPLRQVLIDHSDLVQRLAEVRVASRIGDDISLLRVLDVAIWMPEHTPGSDGDSGDLGEAP